VYSELVLAVNDTASAVGIELDEACDALELK
jgi:hypothetical protein